MQSLRGKLLISSPALYDPNFRRTVILVTHHDADGAMGLVLNRPAEIPVVEAAPQLTELVEDDDPVLVGGPVSPEALMVLAEFDDPAASAAPVLGDVGFVPADAEPDDLQTRRARVFAGYSGWGAGQLEAELEEGSWLIAEADPGDAFAADPEELWGDVLRRMGGAFSLLATMPECPSLN